MSSTQWRTPDVADILSAADVAATARSIAALQEPSGAIPWALGEHTDVWNHVEAAMALLLGGERLAAEKALRWVPTMQRRDGSVPMKIVRGEIEDASSETNMSAYLAVGLWHHWLLCGDRTFVEELWPTVRAGLDFVVSLQLPFGGIAWSQEWADGEPAKVNEEALVAGSSSIHQSLRAGVALAELLDEPQPEWELAGGRLAHALRRHRDDFLDKSEYSMDWYYPVLGGAVTGAEAAELIAADWDRFVVGGLGARCILPNNWVTGAETCELAMALVAIGDPRARTVFADMQHLRESDGRYWTGYVFPDDVNWPAEYTTYTAAAVILAADELSRTTPAAGLMAGRHLPEAFAEMGLDCGCSSADRVADLA